MYQKFWSSRKGSKSEDVKELQAQISHLQMELRMEKLRAELNEEIIKVAESKFNIRIRKKLEPSCSRPHAKDARVEAGIL